MPDAADPIVVNTSPLLALSACCQPGLLRAFHSRVVVPRIVVEEVGRHLPNSSASEESRAIFEGTEILVPREQPSALLEAYLDEGEAAVIALALELRIPLVLIDERRGRGVARAMGLQVTGSVGVLLRAKRAGLVAAVRPCLDAMRSRGVWLSKRLLEFALREAGE